MSVNRGNSQGWLWLGVSEVSVRDSVLVVKSRTLPAPTPPLRANDASPEMGRARAENGRAAGLGQANPVTTAAELDPLRWRADLIFHP